MHGKPNVAERVETLLETYFVFLERQGKTFNFVLALACVALLGAFDLSDTRNYSLTFFYLFPIALTTWFSGLYYGFAIATLCTVILTVDILPLKPFVLVWNASSTFGIFIVAAILIYRVRMMLQNEQRMARTDQLTGVMNYQAFSEAVSYEILRQQRHNIPFSLGYIDLDNFKYVNDRYGHQKGNQVLKVVAACLVQHLRKTDRVARYGGDEFVVLLPETDYETAQVAIMKVRECLLGAMSSDNSAVTFSIGVVTCAQPPEDLDEVVSMADALMYEVKNSGKNNVKFAELTRPAS
jgi:diguanylate cyclase (GGDEF)-like protein